MEQPRMPWQIGDRVRTRGHGLPSGSLGSVEQVLPFGEIYNIRFDALPEPHFLQ